jgi:hypothetical protein
VKNEERKNGFSLLTSLASLSSFLISLGGRATKNRAQGALMNKYNTLRRKKNLPHIKTQAGFIQPDAPRQPLLPRL